ncbi:MAG: hypothetical protein J6C50_03955 [Rickettsiales bacterium]|nr:hypothetical protein [Rickettsiales bacterium]
MFDFVKKVYNITSKKSKKDKNLKESADVSVDNKDFSFDIISYNNLRLFGINKALFFLLYFCEVIVSLIFCPIILVFMVFENKMFLKIFKQVVVILYFVFFLVFVYTLFNQNKSIVDDTKISTTIRINMNKIKDF